MTAAATSLPEGARSGAWLYGRWLDLLVGCGLGYILAIPLLLAWARSTGTTQWPMAVVLLFSMVLNAPHYGATIVRVYEERESRRRYAFFAVHTTLALLLLMAIGARDAFVASLLITVYITWSPWHFSGQNYGLALMFLRRSGVAVDPVTKRLLYASFVLSAGLAILAIHSQAADLVFAPLTLPVANAPQVMFLSVRPSVATPLLAALAALYVASLVGVAWRLRREARPADLLAPALLALTQALWFVVPALSSSWAGARQHSLAFAAIWVSTAHSVQYLWVTAYYVRRAEPGSSTAGFLGKAFLAGSAVTILPGLIFAPRFLGGLPWDVGLAATVFAVVNIHHFILDGAIWKLRDGRVARVLLRDADDSRGRPREGPRRPWLRAAVWTLAGSSLLVPALHHYESSVAIPRATRSSEVERAATVLRVLGRESTRVQLSLARKSASLGDRRQAVQQLQRSVATFPTAVTWTVLGTQYAALARPREAFHAYSAALQLEPALPAAIVGRGASLLNLGAAAPVSDPVAEARAAVDRALEIDPDYPPALKLRARIEARTRNGAASARPGPGRASGPRGGGDPSPRPPA